MHRGGREVHSQTDYILGTDHGLIHNVAVRDARHNTDHYLDMGCLCGVAPAAHLRYIGKLKRFPINPPLTLDGVNQLFENLQGGISKPPPPLSVYIAGIMASY